MKRFIYLFVALFLIVFEAVSEGLALGGHKTIAGMFEFVYLGGISVIVFAFFAGFKYTYARYTTIKRLILIIAGYVLVRFALFDYIYNLCAGLELFYIGNTKVYDKLFGWFFTWSGIAVGHFLGMFKLIAFCIGCSWLLKK